MARGRSRIRRWRCCALRERRLVFEQYEPRTLLSVLTNAGTAADVVYTLPATADQVFLEDDGTSGNGMLQLRSTSGTFDTTVFANPSGSLTINRGDASDTITLNSAPDLTASLTIGTASSPFGSVTVAGVFSLGTDKNISAFASGTIGLNGESKLAVFGAGTISLTTARNIALSTTINGNASITSVDGNITLLANQQATPTSGSFQGIDFDGSTVKATGGGAIIMQGKGGDTGDFQDGVQIRNGAKITGGTGGLQITGVGGASPTGAQDCGVTIIGTSNVVSATGPVTVQGTGGTGTGYYNAGVVLLHNGSAIKSTSSNVVIIGMGYGSGEGVQVESSAQVSAGGSGVVTIQGTGGSGSAQDVAGVDLYQATISTIAGDIQITGQGGNGSADAYDGVDVYSSQVTAGGSGNVKIQGTIGNALFSTGVSLGIAGSAISADSGTIEVTGILGHNVGISIGTSGGSISTTANGGVVTLIGDRMSLHSSSTIGSATGTVILRPQTAGIGVNLGITTDGSISQMGLSDAELDQVVAGNLQIGDATTGPITISANITRPIATKTALISGDAINFDAGGFNTDGGNLTLTPGKTAAASFANAGVDANLGAGELNFGSGSNVNFSVNGTTVDTQYQQLSVAGGVDLTGASLTLSGSYAATPGDTFILVNNDGSDGVTGTFTGLPESAVFSSGLSGSYQITYHGGDGNDVAISAVGSINSVLLGTTSDDTLSIKRNNANVDVMLNGSVFSSLPFASLSTLTVNGLAGNDTLTIDLSAGDVIPPNGLTFNGGDPTASPGDKLIITGGSQGLVTYNSTNAHDGSIVMSNYGKVNYTGLEPIVNSGSATDVVFNLPAGPNTATLGDDGTTGNQLSRLSAPTIETTDFANPSGSLTINTGNSADTLTLNSLPDFSAGLSLGASAAPFGSLTLAGVLALAKNKNLAAYSSGKVSVPNTASAVATSGTGSVTLISNRNIVVSAGASFSVVDGDMVFTTNQQTTPTSGNFTGISMSGTLTTSGVGNILLTGKGGIDSTTSLHLGVDILRGIVRSSSASAGAGKITINGTGGVGTGDNDGVAVEGAGADVESVTGDIQISGKAGNGTTTLNRGIAVLNGGQILSKGTGAGAANVALTGTGGTGTDSNSGVSIASSSLVSAADGRIAISGTASSSTTGAFNQGIRLNGGAVVTTGTIAGGGSITLVGQGGAGTTDLDGVILQSSGSYVQSVTGDIQITGTGGNGSTTFNRGVAVINGGQIMSTGVGPAAANISLTGTGGVGTDSARGIEIFSTTSWITSVTGNISLTGHGGPLATGSFCPGVLVFGGAQISSTGTGDSAGQISISGTAGGGGSGSNNNGTRIEGTGTLVNSVDGDVTIVGSASTNAPNNFSGISAVLGSTIQVTGTGNLSMTGTPGVSGNQVGNALSLASTISVTKSSVTLVGDTMFLDPANLTLNAATVTLLPKTPGRTIDLGQAAVGTTSFDDSPPVPASPVTVAFQTVQGGSAANGGVIHFSAQHNGFDPISHLSLPPQVTINNALPADLSVTMNLDSSNAIATVTFGSGQNTVDIEFDAGINRLGALGNDIAISFTRANRQGQGPLVTFGGPNDDQVAVVLDTSGTTAAQLTDAINNSPQNDGIVVASFVSGPPDTNVSDTLVTHVQLSGGKNASTVQDVIDAINKAVVPAGQPNAGQVVQATLASGNGNTVVALDGPGKTYPDVSLSLPASSSELGLSDDELDTITAGTLQIGDPSSGPISVTSAITRPAATNVNLTSGGAIRFTGGSIDTGGGNLKLTPGPSSTIYVPTAGNDVTVGATGTLSFGGGGFLYVRLGGETVDSQYDQLNVVGNIDLTGINLIPGLDFQPAAGDQFTIINNVGNGITSGAFNFPPDLGYYRVSGATTSGPTDIIFQINYHGGDGNDVVLTAVRNVSPTLDTISDPPAIDEDAGEQLISLTGISSGDQFSPVISVTAVSDNQLLIPDPDVTYSIADGTGSLSFKPLPDQFGVAHITVTVKDNGGTGDGGVDTVTQTFTVTVNPVNDPPSFTLGGIGACSTTDENPMTHGPALPQICGPVAKNLKAGPPNEADQSLTVSISNDNPALFTADGQPKLDANLNLTFTRMPNTSGTANVTITLTDSGGAYASQQVTLHCTKPHKFHNSADVGDRNGKDVTGSTTAAPDGFIVAADVLAIINYINAHGSGPVQPAVNAPPYVDVDADDQVVANDALLIINWIDAHPGQAEAPSESPAENSVASDDSVVNGSPAAAPTAVDPVNQPLAAVQRGIISSDLMNLLSADAANALLNSRRSTS